MLNNILNTCISHTNKDISKLYQLNEKKREKNNKNNKNATITPANSKFFIKSCNTIKLDYSISNATELSADRFINALIKKINNVYKNNYVNAPATGFGDFIRGCYYLLEFCQPLNIDVDFHIYDNNVKHFLKYFRLKPTVNKIIANNIYKFTDINCSFTTNNGIISYKIVDNDDAFISYINGQRIHSHNVFINTVNFPSHFISKSHIERMKTVLEPTYLLTMEINKLMNQLCLAKNDFITYHIRLGDEFIENQNKTIKNNKLQQIINKLELDKHDNLLVISDSMLVKNILTKMYPTIKTVENKAIHTCDANDFNNIKDTLLDFYLMSNSKKIVSFSIYPHGSGFSKWCATTYEIPYVCYSLV